nr:uncharacterized protein LOC113828501 [Penaeus vannamei]
MQKVPSRKGKLEYSYERISHPVLGVTELWHESLPAGVGHLYPHYTTLYLSCGCWTSITIANTAIPSCPLPGSERAWFLGPALVGYGKKETVRLYQELLMAFAIAGTVVSGVGVVAVGAQRQQQQRQQRSRRSSSRCQAIAPLRHPTVFRVCSICGQTRRHHTRPLHTHHHNTKHKGGKTSTGSGQGGASTNNASSQKLDNGGSGGVDTNQQHDNASNNLTTNNATGRHNHHEAPHPTQLGPPLPPLLPHLTITTIITIITITTTPTSAIAHEALVVTG